MCEFTSLGFSTSMLLSMWAVLSVSPPGSTVGRYRCSADPQRPRSALRQSGTRWTAPSLAEVAIEA